MSMNFATNLLPNENQEYNLGSVDKKWNIFGQPGIIDTRTYTDVIATSNDNVGGGFFYAKIRSTTYNQKWHVKTRVHATVPGYADYDTETIFDIWGFNNTYSWYACLNRIKTTSYRPIYYNSIFFTSQTGYNNDCGHWIGFNLYYATNNLNTSYKRTIVADLLECDGCTVEMSDTLVTPTDIPNRATHTNWYSSTNTSFTNFDACNYGLKQSGDANTTSISNLLNNGGTYIADSSVTRYQLLFEKDENTLTPLTNDSNVVATTKTMLTNVEFNAFGRIYYYSSTTIINAAANIGAGSTFWAFYGIDLRYTLNCGTTLTANQPIYLVVTPTSNGKCKIASTTPWTQTLPSTNDGKWYILIGRTYSTYQITLFPMHPVYTHNGTKVIELIPDGIDCSQFITKTDAEFENSVSMGRKANTTIGNGSVAMGVDVEASANSCYAEGGYTTASAQGAHAEGNHTTASGEASHAEGYYTIASGDLSHAEGDLTVASGVASHAEGIGTTAAGALSHAGGIYNVEDSYNAWPEWTANTSYAVGDKVKITDNETVTGYICKTANTDTTFTSSNWTNREGQMNYAEIIGNGTADNARSNARALDWDGNEFLKGNLYVNCNTNSTSGTQVVKATDIMTGANGSNAGTSGLVPQPTATDNTKYLCGDGTWKTVSASGAVESITMNSTTYTPTSGVINLGTVITSNPNMTGANGTNAGTAGRVPAPAATANTKFLRGDATWQDASPCICVKVTSISSLPVTVTCSAVKSTHYCIYSTIASSYVTGDWTITTSNGSFTISGSKASGTISTAYFVFYDVSGAFTGTTS